MKQQFAIQAHDAHKEAICHTPHNARETAVCHKPQNSSEIPTLRDRWLTGTASIKMLCPQKKKSFSLYFLSSINDL